MSYLHNVVWFYSVLPWQQTTLFQARNSLTVLRMSHLRMRQIVNRALPWKQTNLIRLKTQVTADYNNGNCTITVKPPTCQLAHNVITMSISDGFLWILLQKMSCEDLLIEVIKLWPLPIKDMVDPLPPPLKLIVFLGGGDAKGIQDVFDMIWSSFHIKNTISCICHSLICICHSIMCICHSIVWICYSIVCICHSIMCICHSIVWIYHNQLCVFVIQLCVDACLSFTLLCLSILHSIMACCHSIIQYRSNIDWRLIPEPTKALLTHWQPLNAQGQQKWRRVRTEMRKEKRINDPMWPFNKKMDELSTSLNTVEWGGGYFNVAGHIQKNIRSSAVTTHTASCCYIYSSRFWHPWKRGNSVAVPVLQTGCNYWHENQFLRTP